MRRAKIVATLGPATSSYETIRAIIEAGVDVARMNLSHGSYDVHEAVYANVRKAAEDVNKPVAVMVDLQGPKIRLGKFEAGPYDLAEGGASRWDEIKEQVGDLSLAAYRHFVPNLTAENIIARKLYSPLDLERSSPNSMVRGDVHGVAPFFYQTVGHRPTADLGQYTVPGVERLYLVGPFMHPGGGVYGAGRATAMKMFEDLKLNFDKVAAARA